ncbi:nuclear transport factor 2 family protein [Propionibacteriaceae bacterium Y1685]|uniref:nuclear transport factor 2 family protein n=1 Tax=Microlunatus sp. Y1700 TaxID=3418487 RepID=UPI003B810E8C
MTITTLLEQFAECLDSQDWAGLESLLAPGFRARYPHTGESFDGPGFVQLNREYPGTWRFQYHDIVDAGDRGVGLGRVSNDEETYWVASLVSARDGRLTDLVEVWTDAVQAPPADRRPSA